MLYIAPTPVERAYRSDPAFTITLLKICASPPVVRSVDLSWSSVAAFARWAKSNLALGFTGVTASIMF